MSTGFPCIIIGPHCVFHVAARSETFFGGRSRKLLVGVALANRASRRSRRQFECVASRCSSARTQFSTGVVHSFRGGRVLYVDCYADF